METSSDAFPALQTPGTAAIPDTPGIRRHITALDGMRGVAILMVMAFHLYLPATGGGWNAFINRLTQTGGAVLTCSSCSPAF